ncbi:MAG TPA: DUF3263 domain-containing protein [Micromonosporaceae bacterium]|nr:DUF3263 domain-containing protein [Micromonosporaceae bacterium]
MKPPADAPAVRPPVESELDTYPDSDAPAAQPAPVVPAQPAPVVPAQAAPVGPAQAAPVAPPQPAPQQPALTDREQQILAFERQWWRHAGAKEQAIRDTFQLSATRYYQLLNSLLDNPAALAADPVLVGRLRRLRSTRTRSRRR